MEHTISTLDGCKRELKISLAAHELEPYYEKAYLNAQPDIQVQGFRKGKVPLAIIKKRFGKAIEQDAIESIANDIFRTLAEKHDLKPIGRSLLQDIQRNSDGSLGFTIVYEVKPEFELQEYRHLEITKVVRTITDKDIDEEVERFLNSYSTLVDAEQVENDMFLVRLRLNPIDSSTGMPLIGGKAREKSIFLRNEPPGSELKASLLNTKVGDSFRYADAREDNTEAPEMVMATVQSIQRVVPPEFTNAFVEEFTQGEHTTTEEFRADIKEHITSSSDRIIKENMQYQVIEKLLLAHDFLPPQSIVQEILASRLQQDIQNLPDKKLPKNFDIHQYVAEMTPGATNTAKWLLIRDRIIEQENIVVTNEDILEYAKQIISSLPGATTHPEHLQHLISSVLNDEKIYSQVLHEKVMKVILDYAVITEENIDTVRTELESSQGSAEDISNASPTLHLA